MKKYGLLVSFFILLLVGAAQADIIDFDKQNAVEGYKTLTIPNYDEREIRTWTYSQNGFMLDVFYNDNHDLRWAGSKMKVELSGNRFLTFAFSTVQLIDRIYYESEGNNNTFRVYDESGWSDMYNLRNDQGSFIDLTQFNNIQYIEFHGDQNSNVYFMTQLHTETPVPSPLPATVWLFGTGIAGLAALYRKKAR